MMEAYNDLILDDQYKIRISSKKLRSGNYQVKFFASVEPDRELYGYLLVDADETLKEVIMKIRTHLRRLYLPDYQHLNLYDLTHRNARETNFMIFQ